MKSFLKTKEVVESYGIGINTIYKAIHKGELKAYRPNGRDFLLKVSEVESWIVSKPVFSESIE